MKQRKKVIILGKGSIAIRISNWFLKSNEYDLIYTVPVIPEPTWTDSFKNWSLSKNIPIIDSGDYNDIAGINSNDWTITGTIVNSAPQIEGQVVSVAVGDSGIISDGNWNISITGKDEDQKRNIKYFSGRRI